jgi:PKD repeat protein
MDPLPPALERGKAPRRRLLLPITLTALLLVVAQVVLAAPPTGTFEISDNTPTTGQLVRFTPQGVDDPDSGTTSISFNFGDGTTDSSEPFEHTYTSASPAQKTVTMTITAQPGPSEDPAGPPEIATVTRTVTVSAANTNPIADDITWQPQGSAAGDTVPDAGQPVAFHGAGHDNDAGDSIASYEWNFGDGGTATGQNPTHTFAAGNQTYNVTLLVRDTHGALSAPRTEAVRVNARPVANGSVLNNQTSAQQPDQKYNHPMVGQSFVLTPQALPALPGQAAQPGSSDPENGTNLNYRWDLDNNGSYEAAGETSSGCLGCLLHQALPAGAKTVGLQVTDLDGAVATNKVNFRVNSVPVAGFTNDPITPVIGETIRLFSTSTDPDGTSDPLTYAWDLDNDGAFDDSASPTPTVPAGSTAGPKTIKLRVTDSGGLRHDATRTIDIQVSRPKGSFNWRPSTPLPGQQVTFTSTSGPSAADRTITKVEWDFSWNGTTFKTDAVGGTANHAFDSPGAKSVAMKVTETGSTGGGFAIVSDRVVVNAPPNANFSMSDENPTAGVPVTLSSTSADPDGPLASQQWDLDGDGQFDDASSPVVFATFNQPGSYALRLRVSDSNGATSTAVKNVTVRSPPKPVPTLLQGVLIEIKGSLHGRKTRVERLLVKAPRGSKVTVRCFGRSCPKAGRKASKAVKGRQLRFKQLERMLRPRTRIVVRVTKPGFIGRVTTFRMRARKAPQRTDLCLPPGAKKAGSCPA